MRLPPLGEDLRTVAGLTGGAVSSGNACRVLQDGALFPAMEADIAAADVPFTSKPLSGPQVKSSAGSSSC